GLTWTFTLREGVKFHSGNSMSCKDVEYSFEYGALTAHPQGATAYLMGDLWLGYSGDGSDPAAFQAAVTWDMIDNIVECPDGPDATWTDWTGRDITTEFMSTNMSGTGAYQLVEATNESTVASAFADYWGGEPAIKNVVYQYVDEQSTRILALQQGDADRIQLNERSALVQLRGAPGVAIHEDPSWTTTTVTAVFFNFDIATANNEDVGSGQLDGAGIPADFFQDVNIR